LEHFEFTALEFEYLNIACRDRDYDNRGTALGILRNLSMVHEPGAVEPLVTMIVGLLSDPRALPRDRVIDCLVFIHDGATGAIPSLLELVDDPKEDTRDSASFALAAIDRAEKTTSRLMFEWLVSENPRRVAYARHVLHSFGELKEPD